MYRYNYLKNCITVFPKSKTGSWVQPRHAAVKCCAEESRSLMADWGSNPSPGSNMSGIHALNPDRMEKEGLRHDQALLGG